MLSISNSETLLSVTGLSASFKMRLNRERSLRARFIEMMSNPLEFAMSRGDLLHVLKRIEFDAHDGDRIAILGRNGAGKTTLCRFLAGIYRSNKVCVAPGLKVRAILDSGVVIYPELTGRENAKILIRLNYPEADHQHQAKLLEEALAFSELGEFLDTPFRHFSNGMQSRLCLSVATAAGSDIFILDEVFEAADKLFKEKISRRILDLIEQSGLVFFVSHSEEQARRVCNKAMVLENGGIQFFGNLDQGIEFYNQVLHQR